MGKIMNKQEQLAKAIAIAVAVALVLALGLMTAEFTMQDECTKLGSFKPRLVGETIICITLEDYKKGKRFGTK